MRRNIYVKDEDWKLIKQTAAQQNRSASNYLVDLHRLFFLELTPAKPSKLEKFKSHRQQAESPVHVPASGAVSNPNYKAAQKQKNKAASDMVGAVDAQNVFFKPNPKDGKTR